jgi:hypothetical protein
MIKECPDDDHLAFFFGGIGDARHFYYTLALFAASEHRKKTTRKIHFTLNDILPDVFARDLVFFILLDELSYEIKRTTTDKSAQLEIDKRIAAVFYLYTCQLVPNFVNDELQRVILKKRYRRLKVYLKKSSLLGSTSPQAHATLFSLS